MQRQAKGEMPFNGAGTTANPLPSHRPLRDRRLDMWSMTLSALEAISSRGMQVAETTWAELPGVQKGGEEIDWHSLSSVGLPAHLPLLDNTTSVSVW
jgi:hypothetical protein